MNRLNNTIIICVVAFIFIIAFLTGCKPSTDLEVKDVPGVDKKEETPVPQEEKLPERKIVMKHSDGRVVENEYAVDVRTGCMKTMTTDAYGVYSYNQIFDINGYPVGCRQSDGMSVDAYLKSQTAK